LRRIAAGETNPATQRTLLEIAAMAEREEQRPQRMKKRLTSGSPKLVV
jgi:hypothetical protein